MTESEVETDAESAAGPAITGADAEGGPSSAIKEANDTYRLLRETAGRALVGQEAAFELLAVALLTEGHVLLEGVPGTAKTLMAKILARLVAADFRRLQFTADMMPSDVVGTTVFDMDTNRFFLRQGPIFTNVLLADEINRAPAKTQSALLEAMEERQVTLDGERHALEFPFFVVATQNPVEYEGTYPLPEAQLDRFLFKIVVDYPGTEAERELLHRYQKGFDARDLESTLPEPVVQRDRLRRMRELAGTVTVDESVIAYITDIVEATRRSNDVILGASPRASIAFLMASRAMALLRGRAFVTPDDIKELARPILRHRIIPRAEAEIDGVSADEIVGQALARVEVPR